MKLEDKKFDKRTLQFVVNILQIIRQYKELDIGEVTGLLEFLSKYQRNVAKSTHEIISTNVSEEALKTLYSLSRDDLIKVLDDKSKFPLKADLIDLARALHIRNVSKLSLDKIKQKIILVVFDKHEELREMRNGKSQSYP